MAIAPELSAISLPKPLNQSSPIQANRNISQNTSRVSFESELLRLTNLERKKVGLAPLKLAPQLSQAAQSHAVDMARNNYFSHKGLNGSNMEDRAKKSGYAYSALGENIAAGKATPEGTILQWMNSTGHRANILNSKFTEIGFGYANAPNSPYRHYWVQVFGNLNANLLIQNEKNGYVIFFILYNPARFLKALQSNAFKNLAGF